jgi:predicted PurR-regulated permease PerM
MPHSSVELSPATSIPATSLRIIAVAIVVACVYFASSIVITLVCAIFIAFVLDPAVGLMERVRIPRWVASLLIVLLVLASLYMMFYLIYDRAVSFWNDLPRVAAKVKQLVTHIQSTTKSLRQTTSDLVVPPSVTESNLPTVRVQQESPWMPLLLRGIGSVYAFTVTVMFIPFLVFFMLASKHHIWAATLNLFPIDRRHQAEKVINGISVMVREYILGNLLVALLSAAVITPVFVFIDLSYALILGPIVALVSLAPYIGLALAILPPVLVAIMEPHPMWHFVTLVLTVVVVHFVAVNLLAPKLVGRRLKLNPLSVTIAMMFWGWLWGGIGLVLAVPITAALKAICDNVRALKPYGAWMGGG